MKSFFFFFFFNDTATTEIYTLSLHDALPISPGRRERLRCRRAFGRWQRGACRPARGSRSVPPARAARSRARADRKSTRLNSSHVRISYAVFCLKKKKEQNVTFTLYECHSSTS